MGGNKSLWSSNWNLSVWNDLETLLVHYLINKKPKKTSHVTSVTCNMSHMLHVTNIKLQIFLPKTLCVIYFWKVDAKSSLMVMLKTSHVTCITCITCITGGPPTPQKGPNWSYLLNGWGAHPEIFFLT